jgi:hypothetical protein
MISNVVNHDGIVDRSENVIKKQGAKTVGGRSLIMTVYVKH